MKNKIIKKLFKIAVNFSPTSKIRIIMLRLAGYRIGNQVYIGEQFTISDTLNCRNNVHIGDRVSIATGVTLVTSSSPNNSKLIAIYPLKEEKVVIENDVWLGTGCVILPGVTIGECSIVGAGSVITKNVPAYSIVAGVPGKILKKLNKID